MSKKSFMPRTDEKRREWLNANVDGLQNGTNGIAGKYKIVGTTIAQLDSGRQRGQQSTHCRDPV